MIDRTARNRLAGEIRHFVAGLKDNFEFDDAVWSIHTGDAGVGAIRQQMWFVYDDLRRHQLRGEWALSEKQGQAIARCILFLKSDCEYRWPRKYREVPWVQRLISILTLGIVRRRLDRTGQESGAWEVWPFLTVEEFKAANRTPVYLANR